MGVAGLSVSLGSLVTALPQTAQACDASAHGDGDEVDRATVVGAAVYFGLSCALLGLCLAAFFALERLPFTHACKQREAEREARLVAERLRGVPEAGEPLSLTNVAGGSWGGGGSGEAAAVAKAPQLPALMPRLWAWALSLTLVYAVTLGLFPALTSTIQTSAASCSWRHMFVPVRRTTHDPFTTPSPTRTPTPTLAPPPCPLA